MSFISYLGQEMWAIPVVLVVAGLVYALGCWKATRREQLFEFINKKQKQTKEYIVIWKVSTGYLSNTTLTEDDDVGAYMTMSAENCLTNPDPATTEKIKRGQQLVREWKAQFHEINQGNTMTMQHSIPFYRLACFGWQGDLEPMDLAGILNANALYSFTVGTPALLLSIWTIFSAKGTTGEKAVFFIAAFIGFVSFVISLANILQDFTKKLKELIHKEELLESRMENARERINALQEEHVKALNENFERKKKELYSGADDRVKKSRKVAKLAELFENEKKIFSQALYAMYRTDQVTDLLPKVISPVEMEKPRKKEKVEVTWLTLAIYLFSLLLSNGNVALHGYLVWHAIASKVEVTEDSLFFSGIALYHAVCLGKMVPAWMYYAFKLFNEKPKFLTLMENLSPLLPVSTAVIHMGGEYDMSAFDAAGIGISIAEVLVSTYMTTVDPKTKDVLNHLGDSRGPSFSS